MVSDAVVEEVRSRADLVEICGEHMPLKRVGKTFRGPCPLHGGEGPNFSIDPTRDIFKCFVCGEGGDVFSFVMKHLGHDFPSAVRYVAERVGVEVADDREDRSDPHAAVREALAFAEEWFAANLSDERTGRPAREYLRGRDVEPEEALSYALGYAPPGWRGLREAAQARGLSDDLLLEAGLLATSERAEEPYDRFRDRLTFSIQDLRDRPIGFGGRDLSGDEETPKYINSPDSPVFTKGRTLYGLNWSRHAMRKEGRGIVVEGYTDVLALHLAGFESAAAPLGTSLTREHAETLARYADRVYLVFDSDPPGLRATFRSADTLLAAGVHPMVVTLPEGDDPDSLVRREGPDGFGALLEDAMDALERKLQILERRGYLESIEGRRRAVDGLLSTLRAARDPALRDLYIERTVERLGVRRDTLVREIARAETGGRRARRSPARGRRREEPARPRASGEREAEREMLLLLVRDGSLVERAATAGLEPGHFRDDRYREVFRALLETGPGEREADPGTLFEGEVRETVRALQEDATELTHPEEIFRRVLQRLLHREKLERLRAIDRELELADEEQALALLREKEAVRRELQEAGVHVSFIRKYAPER